jgi:hypothetical protein
VCGGVVGTRTRDALRQAAGAGLLTRRYAVAAGLAAGVLSLAGVAAVGWAVVPHGQSEVALGLGLAGVAGVLAASPFLGLWLLRRKCA